MLQIGDFDFAAGFDLTTNFKTEDVELGYNYYIVQRPGGEFGFSAGIHGVLSDITATGSVFVGVTPENPLGTVTAVERDSQTIPLPVFGFHGKVRPAEKLYISGLVKIFEIEII